MNLPESKPGVSAMVGAFVSQAGVVVDKTARGYRVAYNGTDETVSVGELGTADEIRLRPDTGVVVAPNGGGVIMFDSEDSAMTIDGEALAVFEGEAGP
jgi:hypothetical protein